MTSGDDVRSEAARSTKFTYDDFVNFPDDGKRHEIIDGAHYVTPSPNTKHQTVSMNLAVAMFIYLQQHSIGAVFAAPFDVIFSDFDVVEPDLLYISRERSGVLTDKHVRGVPDLVVEIVSAGTHKIDQVTKRKLYERFGVLEYWLVDPERETIKVYRRRGDKFVRPIDLTVENDDRLTSPLLPKWSAPLSKIFASPF